MSSIRIPLEGLKGEIRKDTLIISSETSLKTLSSSLLGGGFTKTRYLLNHHVEKGFTHDSPETYLMEIALGLGISETLVGMMTAAELENHMVVSKVKDGLRLVAVVTGGISNAAVAGEERKPIESFGTINTFIFIDRNLTEAAMAGAIITATEAKTIALRELDVRSIVNGGVVTGTTTDAIAVACTGRGASLRYAGTGTVLGELLGMAVKEATFEAIKKQEKWD